MPPSNGATKNEKVLRLESAHNTSLGALVELYSRKADVTIDVGRGTVKVVENLVSPYESGVPEASAYLAFFDKLFPSGRRTDPYPKQTLESTYSLLDFPQPMHMVVTRDV